MFLIESLNIGPLQINKLCPDDYEVTVDDHLSDGGQVEGDAGDIRLQDGQRQLEAI